MIVGCLWTAAAGAQVYPAGETLQLSSAEPPGDGVLHVGPGALGGPFHRSLVRVELPAIDPGELLRATLVLGEAGCYLGEAPPVTVRPVLSAWSAGTTWGDRPATGGPAVAGSGGICPRSGERIDITPFVHEWAAAVLPNFGLELRGDEAGAGPPVYETPDGSADGLDRRFDPALVSVEVELIGAAPPSPPSVAPVLLRGVLADEFGAPVRDGLVSVWPAVEAEGSSEIPQLASAQTDSSGAFILRLSPSDAAVSGLGAANDGWVNFDAAFTTGNRVQFRSFSRRAAGGMWVEGEGDVAIQFDSAAAIGAQAPGVRTGFSESDQSHSRPGCYVSSTTIGEADKYMVIGEAHVWKDQSMTWAYGERADSDVGVGVSADGVNWAISGSVHVSNRRGSEITDTISNLGDDNGNFGRRYRSEFHFVKLRQRRICLGRATTTYRIKATRWNGGFDYYDDVKDLNGHCGDRYADNAVSFAPASGNGTFTRSSGDFRNYSGAVTVFGVGLSGQSGASKSSMQSWRFGKRFTRYYLCGDTGKPTTAERIYAGF